MSSNKARLLVEIHFIQIESVDPVIGHPGQEDGPGDAGQPSGCARREAAHLMELGSGGHP